MNDKKTLSKAVAKERIDVSLKELRKHWKDAGFLSDEFDSETKIFRKIILDELSSVYDICEYGC
jgi:hypothetical protein